MRGCVAFAYGVASLSAATLTGCETPASDEGTVVSAIAGGTVEVGDSIVLQVPPGALAEDTRISGEILAEADWPAEVEDPMFEVVSFQPDGLEFLIPATLTTARAISEFALEDGVFATPGAYARSASGEVDEFGAAIRYLPDELGVDLEITHFSDVWTTTFGGPGIRVTVIDPDAAAGGFRWYAGECLDARIDILSAETVTYALAGGGATTVPASQVPTSLRLCCSSSAPVLTMSATHRTAGDRLLTSPVSVTPTCAPDECTETPKFAPGLCGCDRAEDTGNTDGDAEINCRDECPSDPLKTEQGICPCGVVDSPVDTDLDGTIDCQDECPMNPDRIMAPC